MLLGLAALKIVFGVAGYLATPAASSIAALGPGSSSVPSGFGVLHMLVYGTIAALLIHNRERDPRALWLGTAFALVAAVPSDRLFARLVGSGAWTDGAIHVLTHLHPDTFLPLCFWLFFRSFPRSSQQHWLTGAGTMLSAGCALVLFVVNAAPLLASGPISELLAPGPRIYLYFWLAVIGLTIPAFGFAVASIRTAPRSERNRVALFVAGIVVGSIPFFIVVLLKGASPSLRAWIDAPAQEWINYVVRLATLTIPVTTAYSVLVNHVLDVRLVVRQALQYALARSAVMAATTIPFAALVFYVYRNRDETIVELLSGSSGTGPLVLIFATLAGLVMVQMRQNVLASVDRRFFREHYDARQILMSLVEGSRRATSPWELADLLSREIDRALHLERISIFVLDPTNAELRSDTDPRCVTLASPLAMLVSAQEQPLEIDWSLDHSAIGRLPDDDQQWLRAAGFRLLVPFICSDGTLVGIAALGTKKSERPFSREDRLLLSTIAGSAALTLENRIKISSAGDWPSDDKTLSTEAVEFALECKSCTRVLPSDAENCVHCEGPLDRAAVPYVLFSKFRLEQRLGAGGMGIVYRAVDLVLGRRVAMKTLPRLSMDLASRLRREARAMASVSHANLALIYGVESWRGSPLLIVELLEGGTLMTRLATRKPSVEEVFELGATLSGVLGVLHDAGILHRDIKPSNVGYTHSGVPKLLDFGLAKILGDSRLSSQDAPHYDNLDDVPVSALTELTATRCAIGTPVYLSPEAANGGEPGPLFDLWALAVLMFEAVSGHHPLGLENTTGLRQRILDGEVNDIRTVFPDVDDAVAEFFDNALARDSSRRAQTAHEFQERAGNVLQHLDALTLRAG